MLVRTRPRRRGAATVEFAVVVPVLLLFLLGIVEIGRLVMVAQVNTSAAREAARYAAQGTADAATIEAYTRNYLSAAGIARADDANAVTIRIETPSGDAWSTVSSPSGVAPGTPVRVTVSTNFNQQSWLPSRFFVGDDAQIRGVSIMRKE